jgi:hypothetical protein
MWSSTLALRVRDHVLVFARSRSVIVSQGTSGGVAAITNGAIMRPNAPYGTTESWSCVRARVCVLLVALVAP